MATRKKDRDPIPEHFRSIEEAAEFWDSHDLADYWDLTREADFQSDIQRRVFLTALEPDLAAQAEAFFAELPSEDEEAERTDWLAMTVEAQKRDVG